jgi:hypothetical protein
MESFIKMMESNDVEMVDLSNNDNKLYQKLIDRSRTFMPGESISDPESLYKYEVLTSQFMRARKQESLGDKILETSSVGENETPLNQSLIHKLNRNFIQS